MVFEKRYDRNHPVLSEEDQQNLKRAKVLVIGCGGLGGYVIESLARIGVGNLTVADADVFEVSNLNRQLLSSEKNLGESKAGAALKRVHDVNSEVNIEAIAERITDSNIAELLKNTDVIIDAVDNYKTRLLLAKAAGKAGVPLIHGAIAGWTARVYTLYPGDDMMEFFCAGDEVNFAGNLPFMAALCASIQTAEAVKILLGEGKNEKKLIEIDIKNNSFESVVL